MDIENDVEDVIADIILMKIYLGYKWLAGKGFPSLSVMLRWNLWIILLFAVGIFLLGKEYEGKPLKPYAIDIPDCRFEVEEAHDTVHGGYIYTIHYKTGETPERLPLSVGGCKIIDERNRYSEFIANFALC